MALPPVFFPPKLVPASDFQFFGGRKMIDERKMSEKKKVQIRIEYRVEQLRKEKRKKKIGIKCGNKTSRAVKQR